jgi:cytochrome d ubiquinol oxidase subunit I
VSLVLFVIVYGIVFGYGIYYINRLIVRGPEGAAIEPPSRWMPGRALSAVEEAGREILSGRPKRT